MNQVSTWILLFLPTAGDMKGSETRCILTFNKRTSETVRTPWRRWKNEPACRQLQVQKLLCRWMQGQTALSCTVCPCVYVFCVCTDFSPCSHFIGGIRYSLFQALSAVSSSFCTNSSLISCAESLPLCRTLLSAGILSALFFYMKRPLPADIFAFRMITPYL